MAVVYLSLCEYSPLSFISIIVICIVLVMIIVLLIVIVIEVGNSSTVLKN